MIYIHDVQFYQPPHLFHMYALYFATRQFNFANE